jgi:dTDP-glucose 4,6-dehydratase
MSIKNLTKQSKILVTGGAGFIGSNFVLEWLLNCSGTIINLDLLSYAGNLKNLSSLKDDSRHIFIRGNIGDSQLAESILNKYQPCAVINFAAESHVDRSIRNPNEFMDTNVMGTFRLLESVAQYWKSLEDHNKKNFRFLHISTDEVYGSLGKEDYPFTENNRYEPNSPYSASKAASDHLVRAYHQTYGLPVLTTNCSNNYGSYQFPEKLIPLIIINALNGKDIPVYGDGRQIRDWLYVKDHVNAIMTVLDQGKVGEVYNVGGWNEKENIEIVRQVCDLLDELRPKSDGKSYFMQLKYVSDRPGHDRRYAIDTSKIQRDLGWEPVETFETGIRKTVQWYLSNLDWVEDVISGEYQNWLEEHYK